MFTPASTSMVIGAGIFRLGRNVIFGMGTRERNGNIDRSRAVSLGSGAMGRAAVITGGTKGIGRGIGLRMAAKGYDLAVNYRRDADQAKKFQAEIEKLGRKCVLIEADQTQDGAVDRVFDEAKKAFGGIDL